MLLTSNQPDLFEKSLHERTVPAAFSKFPHPNVSDYYQFFSTADVIEQMKEEGFYIHKASQGRARKPDGTMYAKHRIDFMHPNMRSRFDNELRPTVTIINSHNRTSALMLALGVLRFVCDNGIVRGDVVGKYKFYHTARNPTHAVMEGVSQIIHDVAPTMDMIDVMKVKQLTYSQIQDFVWAAAKVRNITDPYDAIQLASSHRSEDNGYSVWNVFNRVQENLTKGLYKVGNKQRKARPLTNITKDMDMNTKLWNMAVEYATS